MKMLKNLQRLMSDRRGATAVEYGLILAMVFLAMLGAVVAFGQENTALFDRVSSTTVGAMNGAV